MTHSRQRKILAKLLYHILKRGGENLPRKCVLGRKRGNEDEPYIREFHVHRSSLRKVKLVRGFLAATVCEEERQGLKFATPLVLSEREEDRLMYEM